MISLKPIYQTKAQEKIVFDKIRDFLDELLFDYIDEVMSDNELENSKDDDVVDWITVHGNHIPLKKGQSKEDAIKEFIEQKERNVEVDPYKIGSKSMDIKELRQRAVSYYKEKFAGTRAKNKDLGEIIFSRNGYKKPIAFSADERKLRVFPYLREIVEKGILIRNEEDVHGKKFNKWHQLVATISYGKDKIKARINIREDNNGKLYYDHCILKNMAIALGSQSQSGSHIDQSGGSETKSEVRREVDNSFVYSNSIAEDDYIVNLFFVKDHKTKENASSAIVDGLKSGRIQYVDGYFIIKNRISNRLAIELEMLGGKYVRSVGGYKIPEANIPVDVSQAIARINISEQDKLKRINDYLRGIDEVKDYAFDNLSFSEQANRIGTDLDGQFRQSMSKIHVVPPDMNERQKEEIAKNYTNNLKLYIQKWTDQEIVKLRKDLEPFIMGGVRTGELSKVIQQHKGVSDRKAKFLARQETKLLVSQYQRNRFKQAGVTRYKWSTNLDGRERPWHRKLHGQIFSWDEPPIIDERTGQRGHPGDAFNCRCVAIPQVEDV